MPTTSRLAFVLVLFDQHEWARDWFTGDEVRAALDDPHYVVLLHHVELHCRFDDR